MPTATFDQHELESGVVLRDVPVQYQTWGSLNDDGTNALVVCHALTGSTDVAEWWGPLLGPGRALDTDRAFVICMNVPGSPYGSISPLSTNPKTGARYGADFPSITPRDTVRLHRRLLWRLGVEQVAAAIGGSMGGMHVLEWAFYRGFVRAIVPIAVGGRHSPWQIGWSEAQRQAIYSDPRWQGGTYDPDDPPTDGLAAARMMAMVSYRSRASFEERFGRQLQPENGTPHPGEPPFAVESYLRYQGDKLVARFDANCYVSLTRQMDAHDVSRNRGDYDAVLRSLEQPALVVGIDSDVLYPLAEQKELADRLPHATLEVLHAPHGHDSFLIEHAALADLLDPWLKTHAPLQRGPASVQA
jgi:homoserine O-acetyltransferase